MLKACARPDVITEITLQPVRRYDVDAAILFSDIVLPLKALGLDIDIKPGIGPVIARPIRDPRDLARLRDLVPEDGVRVRRHLDVDLLPPGLGNRGVGRAHQAESRIIDHDLRFKCALREGLADVARGIDASHVEAKHRGPSCAFGGNGFSDIGQSLLPPCDEHELVAMRSKLVRKCSPDPG